MRVKGNFIPFRGGEAASARGSLQENLGHSFGVGHIIVTGSFTYSVPFVGIHPKQQDKTINIVWCRCVGSRFLSDYVYFGWVLTEFGAHATYYKVLRDKSVVLHPWCLSITHTISLSCLFVIKWPLGYRHSISIVFSVSRVLGLIVVPDSTGT